MMETGSWAGAGSAVASLMFLWAMARQFFPSQFEAFANRYVTKFIFAFYPYVEITFPEQGGRWLKRSEAYAAIESYLASSSTERARRLKAEVVRDSNRLLLSMDEYEEVTDEFRGAKVWWRSSKIISERRSISLFPGPEDQRYYKLIFHRLQRELIHDTYLPHVMEQGKSIQVQKRRRKLYTNNPNYDRYEFKKHQWTHVPFEHPATFDTLGMNPDKKQEIVQDLLTFSKSKDYYLSVGKPWKRGYLLYGPPGTGKSTMIAAMANLMDYDVYDLELTAVKNNTDLRKLLIETTGKSIIVLEDIDCSLDLSGKRKKETKKKKEKGIEAELKREDKEESKVTLSGLLNFIDGLWSSCGSERLIVFTTNYKDELDPALTRRGRMDMHIELSYCTFEAFRVLARNYLRIEDHASFDEIKELLEKRNISPADVAENLMPTTLDRLANHAVGACLDNLIKALKECKIKGHEEEKIEEVQEEATKAVVVAENPTPTTLDRLANRAVEACLNGLIQALKNCKKNGEEKVGEAQEDQDVKEEE